MTTATGDRRLETVQAAGPEGPPSHAAVAERIARWLLANHGSDGRILDPVQNERGTYADGFAALTFGLMAKRTGDPTWESACRRAADVASRRPVESEFDSFALLLLQAATGNRGSQAGTREFGPEDTETRGSSEESPSHTITQSPARRVSRPPSPVRLYRGRRLVSNNWVAMRAASYSLRARLTNSDADRREADRLWDRVLGWQTAGGLFIDSPGGDATPITYHAKFCAMLALEGQSGERPSLLGPLRKGLDALAALVSPSGVLVPYGRSRNTLFGYAAAVYALSIGARLLREPAYAETAMSLLARVASYQHADGHVPCVLNDGESRKRDWDVYVNNPDYNAYAAALLLMLGDRRPEAEDGARACCEQTPVSDAPSPIVFQIGPILTVRTDDSYAAFVTTGQPVPRGTPFFCDHRYYGMQPLLLERDGEVRLEAAAYSWRGEEDRRALFDPEANPWLPFFRYRGANYCVRRYDVVSARADGDSIELIGESLAARYVPVSRWERGIRWLLAGRLGRPQPVVKESKLPPARFRRRLVWDPSAGRLSGACEVIGKLPAGAELRQSTQDNRV